jgi:hypothetical protein
MSLLGASPRRQEAPRVSGMDDDTGPQHLGIWPEIRRISEQLVAINTKLDSMISKIDDHESRLRRLEERRFPYSSIAALTAVVSMAVAIVGLYLNK